MFSWIAAKGDGDNIDLSLWSIIVEVAFREQRQRRVRLDVFTPPR
jgi:hypothetical protein